MVAKEVKICNKQGFHMRPATAFSAAMAKYGCNVMLEYQGGKANGKSVMSLVAACIKCGVEIKVVCDGADEAEALETAVSMIESGFGEE